MLIPYWQLPADDVRRISWSIHHHIAEDAETGAYLWSGRQPDRYGMVIPSSSGKRADETILRFRATAEREAFAKGCARLAKHQSLKQ